MFKVGPSNYFGEEALFGTPRIGTAVVHSLKATIYKISKRYFQEFADLENSPKILEGLKKQFENRREWRNRFLFKQFKSKGLEVNQEERTFSPITYR